MNHYIVDLSSNNHDGPIDHKAAMDDLRARGGGAQPGAVVKASEGPSYGNPDYQIDIDGTLAADGAVATYHFLHSSASAESQLANLKNNLARVQNPGKCWADVEEGGLDEGSTWTEFGAVAEQFTADDLIVGDYFNKDTLNNIPGLPFGKAAWFADPDNSFPDIKRDMWQIGQQMVAGIDKPVDINIIPDEAFQRLFGTTQTTVIDPVDPSVPTQVEPTPTAPEPTPAPVQVQQGVLDMWPNVTQANATPEQTKIVQSLLVAHGYDISYPGGPPAGIDGQWGGRTQASVLHFQFSQFGQSGTDGIVGKNTMGAFLGIPK